jgi:hypothetical protein
MPSVSVSLLTIFREQAIAAPPAFAPTDLAGLLAWWKADAGTLQAEGGAAAVADGDPAGQVLDQSGNGNHATQNTSAAKPTLKLNILNGLPALRFDGGDFMTHAVSDTVSTILAVVSVTATGGSFQGLIGLQNGGANVFANLGTADKWGAFQNAQYPSSHDLTTAKIIASKAVAGDDLYLYTNGSSENVGAGGSFYGGSGNRIGDIATVFKLAGDIHELLVYDSALSDEDIDLLGAYLADRWGLVWS